MQSPAKEQTVTFANSASYSARQAVRADLRAIQRLLDENWAVHTRIVTAQLQARLTDYIAYVVEDRFALRGLLLVEPQPPNTSLIVAAAVHDNNRVTPVLEALLPPIVADLHDQHVASLMQIGEANWLTRELPRFGFSIDNYIITYEWQRQILPEIRPHPQLEIRSARVEDLPELMILDQLAFGPTWNKPRTAFREALSRAATFAVGTIKGQIVAYEWADTFGDHAHLTRLATHPHFQGDGIGTQLLHYTLEKLIDHQVRIVTLNTQQDNQRSQELYRRFGFRNTHQEIGVYVKMLENGSRG